MKSVIVQAPAKLNLCLDITGLLPNGYHALDMIMQTITLYDTVTISKKEGGIFLVLPGCKIEADEKNTAFKAARLFYHTAGIHEEALISITKRIPAQAGMAGGSADAAAVLIGLNHMYGNPLSICQLLELGNRIGADVPFSLMGGTCRVQGTGDYLKALKACPACSFVIVMPEKGNPTPAAFKMYDESPVRIHPNTALMAQALQNGDLDCVCHLTGNSLQPCSGSEETEIICKQLLSCGANSALMTGSGAAVYGIYKDARTAQDAFKTLSAKHNQVFLAEPTPFGAKVLETYD